ncbi:hypothetical protein L6452_32975 [Arctium lappa]|uniref:Uncharacterized protein n=1 Tax=Arctium lappa TaxID=4217 RepID=A0ACB8ZAG3_ARCLA|nr:hypothetical protein L6452_32975 [Arctium lappa]
MRHRSSLPIYHQNIFDRSSLPILKVKGIVRSNSRGMRHRLIINDRNNGDAFRVETRSFLKGIDVNMIPPTAAEAEEEAGVSLPNSMISSISGKRFERDLPVFPATLRTSPDLPSRFRFDASTLLGHKI